MGRLSGKVALVTGAGRGQGRSHALRLSREGADIMALDICEPIPSVSYPMASEDDLAQTAKEVEANGSRVLARRVDVRDRGSLETLVSDGIDALGQLDVVVANAGICPSKDLSLAGAFVDAVDVDLVGTVNTVAASLPHLGSGASIIVTGSTAGLMKGTTENMAGSTGGVGYSWAKQTLYRYVEVLALQLAPHMVRMNAIHPTNCDTNLLNNEEIYRAFRPDLENPTREDALLAFPAMQAMPIPFIEPEDVSGLVTFLASDDSRYMTGLNIRLDAGAMLKRERAI